MSPNARSRIGLVGAALLLVSALLQFAAAAQRWLFFDTSGVASEVINEDHLYDYVFPAEPWQSIGSAALLFGIGYVLLAVATVFVAVLVAPRSALPEILIVVGIAAAAPAIIGVQTAMSGLIGAPADLGPLLEGGFYAYGLAQVVGLGILIAHARRRSAVLTAALACLLGTTPIAYFFATLWLVPIAVGTTSHDTTPWTEAFAAVCTLMAAMAVLSGRTVSKGQGAGPIPAPAGSQADVSNAT